MNKWTYIRLLAYEQMNVYQVVLAYEQMNSNEMYIRLCLAYEQMNVYQVVLSIWTNERISGCA